MIDLTESCDWCNAVFLELVKMVRERLIGE